MSALSENQQLYGYLTQNYSTTHYRFEKLFGHSFPYRKLDLDSITDLKLDGIEDLSGIEELSQLRSVDVKGVSDLSALERCLSLSKVKADLPEQQVNVDSMLRLSQKEGMQSCEFYGRGVHSISNEQAMQFGQTSSISYDSIAKFTPEQFSKIQSRLSEVQSLITPEMSEVERVQTVYKNLLPENFKYDYSNHLDGSNGYLINNTMYGPLVEGKGVCSGIASALETALKNAGLDAVSCGGWANTKPTAGDSHQWNQVKVDGQWYNLDLTNDYDLKSWRFFLKSDSDKDWSECHYVDKEDKYEPIHDCTSTRFDEKFREDPNQRMMRELKKQKENDIEQKYSQMMMYKDRRIALLNSDNIDTSDIEGIREIESKAHKESMQMYGSVGTIGDLAKIYEVEEKDIRIIKGEDWYYVYGKTEEGIHIYDMARKEGENRVVSQIEMMGIGLTEIAKEAGDKPIVAEMREDTSYRLFKKMESSKMAKRIGEEKEDYFEDEEETEDRTKMHKLTLKITEEGKKKFKRFEERYKEQRTEKLENDDFSRGM